MPLSVRSRGENGYSPLHIAIKENQLHIMRYLLELDVSCLDLTADDLKRSTMLGFAAFYGNLQALEILIDVTLITILTLITLLYYYYICIYIYIEIWIYQQP